MPVPVKSPTPAICQPGADRNHRGGIVAVLYDPLGDVAGNDVVPKNVVGAVAGEVADAGDLPARTGNCPDIDGAGPLTVRHFPNVGFARTWIEPQHVARCGAAKEMAGACDLKSAGGSAEIDAASPLTVRQLPLGHVAGIDIVPEYVGSCRRR